MKSAMPTPLTPRMAKDAILNVVSQPYPDNAPNALRLLARLNLLNAAIKRPWGGSMLHYPFIKSHVALLMTHLLSHPMPNVCCYLDHDADVAYFCVSGIQVSFHHIPLSRPLRKNIRKAEANRLTWNGLHLQYIAADFYLWAEAVAAEMEHEVPTGRYTCN